MLGAIDMICRFHFKMFIANASNQVTIIFGRKKTTAKEMYLPNAECADDVTQSDPCRGSEFHMNQPMQLVYLATHTLAYRQLPSAQPLVRIVSNS